jgi:putative nucleotidyltransferase with HDIG domain
MIGMAERESKLMAPLPPEETRRLVQRIVDLPTLPIIVPQVLRLVEDQRSSAGDLAQVIGSDQALTSRILRLANSAFYGFRREIVTINHAVVLLGFDTVKSIVLAATVFDALRDGDVVSSFDREQFWLHVGAAAAAARRVARATRAADPEAAFVGGLLHDIGKVVLDRFFYRRYAEAARLSVEMSCPIREAEVSLFSVNHAMVGQWLAERWRFPAAIVEPVAFHHRPVAAGPSQWGLAAVVHLADILTRNAGIGSGGDPLIPLPDAEVLRRLRVGPEEMARWTAELIEEREAVEAFLQVMH